MSADQRPSHLKQKSVPMERDEDKMSDPPEVASSSPPAGASSCPPADASSYPPEGASSSPPAGASSYPPAGASSYPPSGASSYPPEVASSYPPPAASSYISKLRLLPEPVQLLYVLMFSISMIPRDSLYIDKVCQINLKDWIEDKNLTTEICHHLTNSSFSDVQNRTQEIVSELKVYEGVALSLPSVIFAMFAGAWSDQYGRRPLLILPFIGNVLSFLLIMVNIYFWSLRAEWLLLSSVAGVTGGYVCLNLGLYAYVADVTDDTSRTYRMSILNGVFSGGYVVGVQLGGKLKDYYVIFGLSTAVGIVGFLYACFIVNEPVKKIKSGKTASEIFSLDRVKESFKTAFKARENGSHVAIILLLMNFMIFMFCLNTTDFDFLMTRSKFDWEREDFSDYLTVQRICRLAGLLLILPLVSKVLKASDEGVALVGTTTTVGAYTLLAVSSSSWGGAWPLYISAVLQMNSVTTVTIRSQLSKHVDKLEVGRIFAVVGIGQALIALVAYPAFGLIYHSTVNYFPSAYLIIVIVFLGLASVFSAYLYWSFRKQLRQRRKLQNLVTTS